MDAKYVKDISAATRDILLNMPLTNFNGSQAAMIAEAINFSTLINNGELVVMAKADFQKHLAEAKQNAVALVNK